MFANPQRMMELLMAAAAFGLVLAVWTAAVFIWSFRRSRRAQTVRERLKSPDEAAREPRVLGLWRGGEVTTTTVPGTGHRPRLLERLDRLLTSAGWESAGHMHVVGVVAVAAVAPGVLAMILARGVLPGLVVASAMMLALWTYVKYRVDRRTALFESQLVAAMDASARSLRAGHPLQGAFRLVAEEFSPPLGPIFAEICQQQDLGMRLDDAVTKASDKTTILDMKLLAASVVIQLRSGGSLTDMMERAAAVMRDRLRLSRHVRTLTAQTQMSKRILLGLPFFLAAVFTLIRPEYMWPLYSTRFGHLMLCGGGVFLVLGAWIMNQIAEIEY